jgi:2-polyprenyl-6-methoxyphenol hydroxylase-like FAD-dependent oxidoreductase
MALLLARAGWSVALVERRPFPRRKVCGEYLSATNLPFLAALGLAETFQDRAGPPVRRVGLFCGNTTLSASLPRPSGPDPGWGQALGREHLDTLLLHRAEAAGVAVRQPCAALALGFEGDTYRCHVQERINGPTLELASRIIVAAHGSWEPGSLPTQPARLSPRASDLLGFKAHFRNSDLPRGLMPLLAFPGGYGGMVHTDTGRVSLSCCVRRDQLESIRQDAHGEAAGAAVLEHISASCLGVRRALAGAVREGPWLSAGPIRPGIRSLGPPGVFAVGNCAGEAHPVIAEGISMALQAAWLLADHLQKWRHAGSKPAALAHVGQAYAQSWRKAFAPRLYAAAAVAHWAMRPAAVAASLPALHCFPGLLSWGARLSGKASRVIPRWDAAVP